MSGTRKEIHVWPFFLYFLVGIAGGCFGAIFGPALVSRISPVPKDGSVHREMASTSSTSAPESAQLLLRLNLVPAGGTPTITLNSHAIDSRNPIARIATGVPLELIVSRDGFRTYRRQFYLDEGQFKGLKEWTMDVPLVRAEEGN